MITNTISRIGYASFLLLWVIITAISTLPKDPLTVIISILATPFILLIVFILIDVTIYEDDYFMNSCYEQFKKDWVSMWIYAKEVVKFYLNI